MQEMVKSSILMPSFISICYRHKTNVIKKTKKIFYKAFEIYKKALLGNSKKYLLGKSIKPVFRKFN